MSLLLFLKADLIQVSDMRVEISNAYAIKIELKELKEDLNKERV